MSSPLLYDARAAVVRACQSLSRDGLIVGTAGNVSVRVGDLVVISPSGVDYDALQPHLVGVHRLDGTAVDAPLAPSSELPLHLAVYAAAPHSAIVHTHAPASTAVSTIVDELPASHYYTAMFGGPVRVAPYALFGTAELAAGAREALQDRRAALLGNHGAVTVGGSLDAAMRLVPYLEYLCEVFLKAAATGLPIRTLDATQLESAGRALHVVPAGRHNGSMNTDTTSAAEIVVGYDGSPASDPAITWAAQVASSGGRRLVLLTTARPLVAAPGAALFDTGLIDAEAAHLRRVLDQKVEEVRRDSPGLDVEGRFRLAGPALALIEASEHAALVVLGTRRLRGVVASILGGVADSVVTHARGPVAIVPERGDRPRTGPVVVGVDARSNSSATLDFAARFAAEHGRELVMLHAWDVHVPWRYELLADAERTRQINDAWETEMDGVVDALVDRYPGLTVRTEVVSDSAVDALVERSAQACLVVVGTRGRGGFAGLLLGSTSRRVLQSTVCPAVVVPTPHS